MKRCRHGVIAAVLALGLSSLATTAHAQNPAPPPPGIPQTLAAIELRVAALEKLVAILRSGLATTTSSLEALRGALDVETQNRTQADNALQAAVAAEALSRTGADSTLASALRTETENREYADQPAYDSGWKNIAGDEHLVLDHNIGLYQDYYKVEMEFLLLACPESGPCRASVSVAGYGGTALLVDGVNKIDGAYWYDLTDRQISVYRGNYDRDIVAVRIRIWVVTS